MTANLRALLEHAIDYAGLYPPASLLIDQTLANYDRYRASPEAWLLNRLILPLHLVDRAQGRRVSLLAESDPGTLPSGVETVESKSAEPFSRPVYRELPLGQIEDGWAKVRTGAVVPNAIPSCADLARFLVECAQRKLAFKATAGLHHVIRAEHALTYAPDSPRDTMHGFLNVFTAAVLAWHGASQIDVESLLAETDPYPVCTQIEQFTTAQIEDARRNFAHSFGSCSFEEPIQELRQWKLIE